MRLPPEYRGSRSSDSTLNPSGGPTAADVAWMANEIRQSRANIVWIGLGTPRQDYLVPELAELTKAVVVPIGAAFDFWSGKTRQAPAWLHRTGLEWGSSARFRAKETVAQVCPGQSRASSGQR
jgi:N-acetylglucosaminyldiphosphoundecaprenol N-acetyl-beta-D-mannosaminyltransferase